MGCGCGGSKTPSAPPPRTQVVRQENGGDVGQLLAQGGPGQPSYTWNGPERPGVPKPQ